MTRVKRIDLQRAQARVGRDQAAVRWALAFLDIDVATLSPGEEEALTLELFVLTTHPTYRPVQEGTSFTTKGDLVGDLRVPPLAVAQQILRGVFQRAAAGEPPAMVWRARVEKVERIEGDHRAIPTRYIVTAGVDHARESPNDTLQAVAAHLLTSLSPGWGINACQAPRFRQTEPCGRLFLTRRAVQRYCSLVCQQRAGHRRNWRRRPHRSRIKKA
jgi:hypothetical protein